MFLRKNFNKKTGRTHLAIVQGFRDEHGITRHKTIMTAGYLDVLEKEYEDPIKYFENIAKQMTEEYEKQNAPISLNISLDKQLELGNNTRKNFGYAILSKIYHDLKIDYFIANRQRYTKAKFNHNSILKLLIFSRLISPSSKKKNFEDKERFFEKSDFSLDDIYRSLSFFQKHKDAIQLWLHEQIKMFHGRDTSLVYYDVTNYYFEIDEQDEMRRKGVSKEHRPNPIIQMGLFMDTNGIPISYELFSGNTVDKQTLIPMMDKIQEQYSMGKIIIIADKGLITGDNISQVLLDKNGYVFSYSIRGSKKEFKDYVLNSKGYRETEKNFKIKSRLYPREIYVTNPFTGKRNKTTVDEKQVVFYSKKYAEKARADRIGVLMKAKDIVNNPSKYNKSTSYGAAKYIKNIEYDPMTGEIIEKVKKILVFDESKLKEEEKFDGYYAIVTSEWKESSEKIIEMYKGLWKIEETFKVMKSDIETRPVYLSIQEHIEAHFLICFLSLVIARVLEYRMKGKYAITAILESIKKTSCSLIDQNLYLFNYYDEILADIGNEMNIDFSKKYMTLGEIKKILGRTKK